MGQTVGIFGGSFDPPHVGHLLAVAYALSVHPLDAVLVVPVFQHAFGKDMAPFDARMEMARLAMGWLPGVSVSDLEQRIGGESRTLYTLEALLREDPSRRLRLLIGSDVLGDLPKWHRFDRVAELAPPIVLGRAGHQHRDAPAAVLPEVSSTSIRALADEGRLDEAEALVPRAVRAYIDSHGLYGAA
jgi:nicotinate-nucleotide adenylyltransferase